MRETEQIRLLPEQVANKIAAGEVVERPASVVKELMENAIDSGARWIEVHVTAGGRKLIEIRDDGRGMSHDNALMSIERQATSKIRDVDDIERIDTLGFRGEAIPAIASVSRFTLKSCQAGSDEGTEIVVMGGKLQDVKAVGFPQGTTVEVRDLFFNVPARRKFLRSYQTEQAHIRAVFTLHALAHPEIGMLLKSDGREVVRLSPGATLEERIRELFGNELLAGMRPVARDYHGVSVTGFVGLPSLSRSDRGDQYIFVNGRPASAAVIAYALREAYPPLEGERKPVIFLFIRMNPEMVDVNVHPTKREVRFRRPADVREAVIEGICAALGRQRRVSQPSAVAAAGWRGVDSEEPATPAGGEGIEAALPVTVAAQPPPQRPGVLLPLVGPATAKADLGHNQFDYPGRHLPTPQAPLAEDGSVEPHIRGSVAVEVTSSDTLVATTGTAPWEWCKVVGSVGGQYLLLEIESGYVTLDPRAAFERVFYERLLARSRKGEALSQRLLLPESVTLPPAQAERLRIWLESLQRLGFGVSEFGDNVFLVDALPPEVVDSPCRALLLDICDDLDTLGSKRGAEGWREDAVARAACASAAKHKTPQATAAIESLVCELAACRMPYTCPRGRPTMILTTYRELGRKFGRG
ncbi:MAG: DNA mismatch repair endonuclease MutL [Lentisphaerae bacterium]|nr:DNA mismatch repair endonuclease MutL [Lentisphaerota bacterium]